MLIRTGMVGVMNADDSTLGTGMHNCITYPRCMFLKRKAAPMSRRTSVSDLLSTYFSRFSISSVHILLLYD